MIIPKQYLKTIKRTGLGAGLFSEMRYKDDGSENPDFVLNKPAYRQRQDPRRRRQFRLRLVARTRALGAARLRHPLRHLDRFRRHLLQQLLQERHPADQGQPEDLEKLMDDARRGANATLTVDLPKQEIRGPDGGVVKFEIDPFRKQCLLEGLDDIGLTLVEAPAIDAFEEQGESVASVACERAALAAAVARTVLPRARYARASGARSVGSRLNAAESIRAAPGCPRAEAPRSGLEARSSPLRRFCNHRPAACASAESRSKSPRM